MTTIDLKRTYRTEYTARSKPQVVDVPARPYLMIDGVGDPNTSPSYRDAVSALYALSYGIRKAIKDIAGIAYTVMPLEGLWWVPEGSSVDFDDKSNWNWTVMICQPEEMDAALAAQAIETISRQKDLVAGPLARLERFGDGLAAQVLHLGPFSEEASTIETLHRFIEDNGYRFRGTHHEIYLSDPRKVDPVKQRTIIRQPIDDSVPR